jgi:hypothetical protein
MGALPKPGARQPNRGLGAAATVRLPSSGRSGPTPKWPLGRPRRREAEIWERLWQTPQAIAWERLGWTDAVARYARVLMAAELPDAHPLKLSEARQLEDRLGLSPLALLRLRWEIVDGEGAAETSNSEVLDIRERLKAVE